MPRTLKQVAVDMANAFTRWQLWQGGGSSTLSDLTDVELTDLQTDDVLQYNGNKWINAIIQGGGSIGAQIDTLWNNPSPLTSFASQVIDIDMNYDLFIVDYRATNNATEHYTIIVNKVVNRKYRMYCNSGGGQDYQYTRNFIIQENSILFESSSRIGIAYDNSTCIPTVIYGIKFAPIEGVEEITEYKMQDVYAYSNNDLIKNSDSGTKIMTILFDRIATSFNSFYEYCINRTSTTIKAESSSCHLYRYGNIRVFQIYGMTYSALKTVTLDTSDRPSNNHGYVGRAGAYSSAFFLLSTNGKIEGSYQQTYGSSYTELTDSMPIYSTFVWVI